MAICAIIMAKNLKTSKKSLNLSSSELTTIKEVEEDDFFQD